MTSQYRCETCKNMICQEHLSSSYRKILPPDGNGYTMYSPEQFTERYGCASHSDFNPQDLWTTNDIIQHEKLAADAERKKVLDDVIGFAKINSDFINKGQDGYAVIRLVTLVQICEKLREGKDGE